MTNGWWGGWFPDAAGHPWFGAWFPDATIDPTIIPAAGPSTVTTLLLEIQSGLKLTYSFATDILSTYSGLETRASLLTLPRQHIQGTARLVGADVLTLRGQLARYAAAGKAFLLGLPHEALPIAGVSSVVVSVPGTAYVDWCAPGQRVIATSSDGSSSVVGVIQDSSSTTITLDVSLGFTIGTIAPAVPVYLDAQQGFQRYVTRVEDLQLAARNIMFGYESAPAQAAWARLSGYTSGYLFGAIAVFAVAGTIGNGASLTLVGDGVVNVGTLSFVGQAATFHFKPGVTTIQDLLNNIGGSNISFAGTLPALTSTLRTTLDEFGPAPLAHGFEKSWGTMGSGASVATYLGAPLWDRPIEGATVADSIHSMAELLDLGGTPQQFQTAYYSDWGRVVAIERLDAGEWRWLKAFLYAARGCQVAFWLPSWRADLTAVSLAPGVLTVSSTSGDFFAWYPNLRSNLMVVTPDGAIQYVNIISATDNHDGTISLAILSTNAAYNDGGGGSTVTPTFVSWMDFCRFEGDDFEVTFSESFGFSFSKQARAVRR